MLYATHVSAIGVNCTVCGSEIASASSVVSASSTLSTSSASKIAGVSKSQL